MIQFSLQRNHLHLIVEAADWVWLDPFSSAPTFDGWADRRDVPMGSADPPAVLASSVWLLTTGWKRHGALSVGEMPRS